MKRKPNYRTLQIEDVDPYIPSAERPVRARTRAVPEDAHFEPHQHPWAQLAYCASGLIQVTVAGQPASAAGDGQPAAAEPAFETTFIVPPSRAVWIPPGAQHAVWVLEAAQLRTLYLHAPCMPAGWSRCRVLVVSGLLRELISALGALPPQEPGRETALMSLVLGEIQRADTQALGVPLPHPTRGDKRLRALCEAVLRGPGERANLRGWVHDIGASERTVARLFKSELGTTFQQWRLQAVLAHALPQLARGVPVSQVAAASGYASDSAFSAMFKAAMGRTPSHFAGRKAML